MTFLNNEPEVPLELMDKVRLEAEKHHRFPSRGNPNTEQWRIREGKIKQEISERLAILSMAPALLGQHPRAISRKMMPFISKQYIQWWENVNNADKPVPWLQLAYWSKKIDKMSVSDWNNIQSTLHKLYAGYLKQILETVKFSDAMLKAFIRADFAVLYVLPLTRASIRRIVNIFIDNDEMLRSFQENLEHFEEGGEAE
jgi:hypothetical protein